MKIFLAGASGAIGLRLVPLLRDAGHEVYGLTRTAARAGDLVHLGAEPVVADVLDRQAFLQRLQGVRVDVVVNQLTALRRPPLRHRHLTATDVLRTRGTTHLVAAARAMGAQRFVTQSMVFGYGYANHFDTLLAEEAPFGQSHGDAFDPHVRALGSTEEQVRTADFDGIALRFGLFRGDDPDGFTSKLRARQLPVARGWSGDLPFVHIDDAATATIAALERGRGGEAYNITDDQPLSWTDYIEREAAAVGAPSPRRLPSWRLAMRAPYAAAVMSRVSMHVSNEKAKKELDWTPDH
jgi:nucleoside-diphosphate-sugar epimerase